METPANDKCTLSKCYKFHFWTLGLTRCPGTCHSRSHSQWGGRSRGILRRPSPWLLLECGHWSASTPVDGRRRENVLFLLSFGFCCQVCEHRQNNDSWFSIIITHHFYSICNCRDKKTGTAETQGNMGQDGRLTAWASSSSNFRSCRLQSSSRGRSRSHTLLFTLAMTVLSASPWLHRGHNRMGRMWILVTL